MKNLIIIFCPSLSQYPEQPKDQSQCEAVDCPDCNNLMWLSEKKKKVITMAKEGGHDLLLLCYDCFEKKMLTNPEFAAAMKEHIQINI